jgi:hypothetical protein
MKTLFILIISSQFLIAGDPDRKNLSKPFYNNDELKRVNLSKVYDTLFTSGDYFVEIDLSKQTGYLHSRSDSIKTFKVSTGTSKIKDGVETNTGIFVIQHKAQKWYSTQFDSTLMLNWMGFNYGIGFHALAGKSYYKFLGKKTSSHGCIRLSREDAKELFSKLTYGTPVLIHKGQSAIKIAFTSKDSDSYKYYDNKNLLKEIEQRMIHLYNGNYLMNVSDKILIDHNNVSHAGISIGDYKKVPARQKIYPESIFIEIALPESKPEIIPAELFSTERILTSLN